MTETARISAAGTPRKLIWVWGLAVPLPGAGETSTPVLPSAAVRSSVAGRHEGETPPDAVVVLEPDSSVRLGESSTIADTPHASAAIPRMMSP